MVMLQVTSLCPAFRWLASGDLSVYVSAHSCRPDGQRLSKMPQKDGYYTTEVTEGNFLFDARSPAQCSTLVMTNFAPLALNHAPPSLPTQSETTEVRGPMPIRPTDRWRKSVGMRHKSPFREAYSEWASI